MRILLLTLLAGTLPLLAEAQTTDLYTDQRDGTLNDRYALGYFMTPRDAVVAQGSVFLLPVWTPGTIQIEGRAKPLSLPLKYDVYNQEVRAKKPDGDSVAVPVAKVKEFTLAARRFVCYPAATRRGWRLRGATVYRPGGAAAEVREKNAGKTGRPLQ